MELALAQGEDSVGMESGAGEVPADMWEGDGSGAEYCDAYQDHGPSMRLQFTKVRVPIVFPGLALPWPFLGRSQ